MRLTNTICPERPRRRAVLALLAGLTTAAAPAALAGDCAKKNDADAAAVRAARADFNRALADKDIDAVAAVLSDAVTLVSGTNSDLIQGRDAQLDIWRSDFESADRAVYVRTTTCVRLSPIAPIALESGRWRGARVRNPENFAAGSYAAKWRRDDGVWRIEAEIFATEDCGGDFCPAPPEKETDTERK